MTHVYSSIRVFSKNGLSFVTRFADLNIAIDFIIFPVNYMYIMKNTIAMYIYLKSSLSHAYTGPDSVYTVAARRSIICKREKRFRV